MKTDTPRAIAARTNGAKSRGPKTEEGKKRSSQNALKHGFTAAKWIKLPGDEEGAFESFMEGMLGDLKPNGPYQEALAEFIINCMWQLRRVPVFEATLVRDEVATFHSTGIKFYRHDWPQAHVALARYTAHLDRCRYRAVKELRELQAEQRAADMTELADLTDNPQHPIPNTQYPNQKLQNEPKPDDFDVDDVYQRLHERRREMQTNAVAEHPKEEKKTTAQALSRFRTGRRK